MVHNILGMSTLYQNGKIQVPANIRKKLGLKDKDKLVFYEDSSGKIYISNNKIEEHVPKIYYADQH